MAATLSEKIYRGFVALIGICAVSLYAWMFYDIGGSSTAYRQHAERHSEQETSAARVRVAEECTGLAAGALRKCETEIVEPARQRERDQYDLEAQRGMAKWTLWLVIIAAGQLLATAIGLVFIKGTLEATQKAVEDTSLATEAMLAANKISDQVLETTRRSADDAYDFNRRNLLIARETAADAKAAASMRQKIERAYIALRVQKENFSDVSFVSLTIQPTVVNAGKTLGYLTGASFDFIEHLPEKREYRPEAFREYPLLIIAAEGGETDLEQMDSPAMLNHFYFVGYVEYEDMFGDEHCNRFCYEIRLLDRGYLSKPAGGKEWHEWD